MLVQYIQGGGGENNLDRSLVHHRVWVHTTHTIHSHSHTYAQFIGSPIKLNMHVSKLCGKLMHLDLCRIYTSSLLAIHKDSVLSYLELSYKNSRNSYILCKAHIMQM